MKKAFLLFLPCLVAIKLNAQQTKDSLLLNVIVKETQGGTIDPETYRPLGKFRNVFLIDTLKNELRNVSHQLFAEEEMLEIYYFKNNKLIQVIDGKVKDNKTLIQDTYNYSEEDYKYSKETLRELKECNRKYYYLYKANGYLAVLQNKSWRNLKSN